MNAVLIITPVEWVMLLLAAVLLVQSALVCLNLRNSLAKAKARAPFRGLLGSFSDVRQRANLRSKDG